MPLHRVPAGKCSTGQGTLEKPFNLQTPSAEQNQGRLRDILVPAEAQQEVSHGVRRIDPPGCFITIQINKAEVEAQKIDHPPALPDKLGLRDPRVTVLVQIFDDLRHDTQGVAPLYSRIGFRGSTGQFGALRAIIKPEEGEETLFAGI